MRKHRCSRPLPLQIPAKLARYRGKTMCWSTLLPQDKRSATAIAPAEPAFIGDNLQAVLQGFLCAGPPDDNARNQYEHEHQRTYPHNHLAPEYSAVRLHAVQQPAVQAKHGEEERRTLIPPFYLTGILVYINGCPPRFRQTDPTGTFRIGRDGDACNSNTVRQCFGDFLYQVFHGKRSAAYLSHNRGRACTAPLLLSSNTSAAPEKQITVIISPKGTDSHRCILRNAFFIAVS